MSAAPTYGESSPPSAEHPSTKTGDALRDLIAKLEGRFDGSAVWVHFQGKEFESKSKDLVDAIRLELRQAGVALPTVAAVKSELGMLAAQVRKSAPPTVDTRAEAGDIDDEEGGPEPGKAKLLGMIIRAKYKVTTARSGREYLERDGIALSAGEQGLKRELAGWFFKQHGMTITEGTIKETISGMIGAAILDGKCDPYAADPPIRVAGDSRRIVINLLTGEHLAIDPKGAQIEPAGTSQAFRRRGLLLPLPRPVMPQSERDVHAVLDETRDLLGMSDAHTFASVCAWWIASLRPQSPYPILAINGEAGAGKSFISKLIRATIDPREELLTDRPKEGQDIAIACGHQHVVAYDNLEEPSADMANVMCRVATGASVEVRKLYSDDDLSVLPVRNPLLVNGIGDLSTRPDLLSRTLPIQLGKRVDRFSETELFERFEELHPRLFGALVFAMSRAMSGWRSVRGIPDEIRMREPCQWAIAAETVLGFEPGTMLSVYAEALVYGASVASDNPVLIAVVEFMKGQNPDHRGVKTWDGTIGDLLDRLNAGRVPTAGAPWAKTPPAPAGWPKAGNKLSEELVRLAGALRAAGVTHEKLKPTKVERRHHIEYVDPKG